MDPIWITAASGLRSRMEALDVLSNNLANAATDGYKGDQELYNLYFAEGSGRGGSSTALPVIEGQWTDFSQGLLQPTGNSLDFAIEGEGFFGVNGPSGPLYTRNGSFRLSKEGVLETKDGYAVRLADGGTTVRVDAKGALEMSPDGTLRQGGRTLGRLEVVRFDDMKVLTKHGSTYFRAPAAAKPSEASGATVLQGKLEASNVSAAESAVRMVGVLRQFEMLQKAVSLASEMDQKAINEVAKVGG